MLLSSIRRRLPAAALLVAALASTACDDDDLTDLEDEPNVATMRLVVGTQTINVVAATGVVTGGPIVIARGASVNVNATFLTPSGSIDPVVSSTAFRLSATSFNTSVVTFTPIGSFNGLLTGVSAGTTTIEFGLFHQAEQHNEFAWPVTVTVTP
jgi:hypothetical protein